MTTNTLKHGEKRCNGTIVADISNKFIFSTPSISASPSGLSLGTLEIRENPVAGKMCLKCIKCGEEVNLSSEKSVVTICSICHRTKSAHDTYVSYPFGNTCGDCTNVLQGKQEPESEEIKEIISLYLVPPGTVQFVSLIDVLKKSV